MKIRNIVKANPIRSFILLTFLWSWAIWSGLYFVIPEGMYSAPGVLRELPPSYVFFFIAGGMGPSITGIILTRILEGKGSIKKCFSQFKNWRLKPVWYFIVLFTAPLLASSARILQFGTGGELPTLPELKMIIPTIIMGILAGLLEEFGWRGFFLPRILSRFHPLAAGLIVGLPWGLWHFVPAYWGVGSIYGSSFWLFFLIADILNLTAYSILMAFVFNTIKGRIQLAILFHASMSASISIFLADLPSTMETIKLLSCFSAVSWIAVIVALIVHQMGFSFLSRRQIS